MAARVVGPPTDPVERRSILWIPEPGPGDRDGDGSERTDQASSIEGSEGLEAVIRGLARMGVDDEQACAMAVNGSEGSRVLTVQASSLLLGDAWTLMP